MKTPAAPWPGRTGAKELKDSPIFSSAPSRPQAKTKQATHARPPGPGELARARELRKRGLHLRLIEAWRPYPSHVKTERSRHMNKQELTSLRQVIRYLWRDEQKNFEECELNDGKAPDDHIFRDVETLDRYLTREQTADAVV